jgi:hypothetical protein
LLFWFSMCFPFLFFFSSLKIIRISYRGEHNASVGTIPESHAAHATCNVAKPVISPPPGMNGICRPKFEYKHKPTLP